MTNPSPEVRERRLRRMLARQGLLLEKCRRRDAQAIGFGGYRIVRNGVVIAGGRGQNHYALSLDACEQYALEGRVPRRAKAHA